jgi:hypothetical protein
MLVCSFSLLDIYLLRFFSENYPSIKLRGKGESHVTPTWSIAAQNSLNYNDWLRTKLIRIIHSTDYKDCFKDDSPKLVKSEKTCYLYKFYWWKNLSLSLCLCLSLSRLDWIYVVASCHHIKSENEAKRGTIWRVPPLWLPGYLDPGLDSFLSGFRKSTPSTGRGMNMMILHWTQEAPGLQSWKMH